MNLVQAVHAMRWVEFAALLVAASLAMDVYLRSRGRSALLMMAGLALALLGSLIVPVYGAMVGLFADPYATQRGWQQTGEAMTWFAQILGMVGRGLLIPAVLLLGRHRLRTGRHLRPWSGG